ncbi:hypothetical protein [Legionella qingyii]|nr:hypothetical protein [Legionella qingyii]
MTFARRTVYLVFDLDVVNQVREEEGEGKKLQINICNIEVHEGKDLRVVKGLINSLEKIKEEEKVTNLKGD